MKRVLEFKWRLILKPITNNNALGNILEAKSFAGTLAWLSLSSELFLCNHRIITNSCLCVTIVITISSWIVLSLSFFLYHLHYHHTENWSGFKSDASQAGTKKQQKRSRARAEAVFIYFYSPRVVSRAEARFDDSLAVPEHVELGKGHVRRHLRR